MLNDVKLVGRLGADPKITTFQDGGKITNVNVATWINYWNKEKNDWETRTEWHRVVSYDKFTSENLSKGDMVLVIGSNRTRSYEDEMGVTKYTTEVVGKIKPLPKPKADSAMQQPPHDPKNYQQTTEGLPGIEDEEDDLPF